MPDLRARSSAAFSGPKPADVLAVRPPEAFRPGQPEHPANQPSAHGDRDALLLMIKTAPLLLIGNWAAQDSELV
jgi:hypothetical protein